MPPPPPPLPPQAHGKPPHWARVTLRQSKKARNDDHDVSISEEEVYLRQLTQRALCHRVDQAVEQSIEAHTKPLVYQLKQFFDMVAPEEGKSSTSCTGDSDNASPSPSRKRQRLSSTTTSSTPPLSFKSPLDELHELLAMEQPPPKTSFHPIDSPTLHSPMLLPMAMVHTSSTILDRLEILQSVAKGFHNVAKSNNQRRNQTNYKHKRPAVVRLRSSGEERNADLFRIILRQCIAQESQPAIFRSLLKLAKKSSQSQSASQALLAWAQNTILFDSIVILLENVESFSPPILQDFLQRLTSLRAEDGVPVCVVSFCIMDGRKSPLQLRSSTQGMVGMLVRDFAMPPSRVMYDRVFELLWVEQKIKSNQQLVLPVILPASVLRCIREDFVNHHSSVVRAATSLKQALSHHLTQRGGYFLATECEEIMRQEWGRLAWFCVDDEARKSLIGTDHENNEHVKSTTVKVWIESVRRHRRALQVIFRLIQSICELVSSVPEWIEDVITGDVRNTRISELFQGLSQAQVLLRLVYWRKELQHFAQETCNQSKAWKLFHEHVDGTSMSGQKKSNLLKQLMVPLNELIVLVDSGFDDKGLNFNHDLTHLLEQWVRAVFKKGTSIIKDVGKDSNPMASLLIMSQRHANLARKMMSAEQRRSVSNALLDRSGDHNEPAAAVMFRLIRTRIEISRNEWFQLFLLTFPIDNSDEKQLSIFAHGIYELLYCGLIREKRGNNRLENMYEKAALVWCSGD